MSFEWGEFLELARALQGHSSPTYSEEASDRTAVSRAYYAAFGHARNYAMKKQNFKPTFKPEDHRFLRNHFREKGEPWIEVAESLQDLRIWRNMCDYENTVSNLSTLTTSAIKNATKIFKQCR